jgi:hypothetical protein
MRNRLFLLLCVVMATACGGDDKKAADCPPGNSGVPAVGDLFTCTCEDPAVTGTQACGADMKLTSCDCGAPCPDATLIGQAYQCMCGPVMGQQACQATGMLEPCNCATTGTPMGGMMAATGGMMTTTGGTMTATGGTMTATGGTMMTGGTMAATGAIGGEGGASGMMSTGGVGGTGIDDGGIGGGDGAQLDPCSDDVDCGGGLVCYQWGGFCTEPCSMMGDPACDSIAGGSYSCGPAGFGMGTGGACRIICTDESDTSCPDPLTCQDVSMGGMPSYRCAL